MRLKRSALFPAVPFCNCQPPLRLFMSSLSPCSRPRPAAGSILKTPS